MPYHVEQNSSCPADNPYAVVNDDTGEVMSCNATQSDADAQAAQLNAAEAPPAG